MFISILTITKNNSDGLKRTAASISNLMADLTEETTFSFEWVVKSGDHVSSLGDYALGQALPNCPTKFDASPDDGIYDAMNGAVNLAEGDWVLFMNSGDAFAKTASDFFMSCLKYGDIRSGVFYGGSDAKSIFPKAQRKLYPRLARLPPHQAMLIPIKIQKRFSFDRTYPVSADKDFKIRTIRSGVEYIFIDKVVCLSEPGGVSVKMANHEVLWKRTQEQYFIMEKNFGTLAALAYTSAFYLWNSRKIFL